MNHVFVMFMHNVFMMLNKDILVMLMNNILVDLLDNGCSLMRLDHWCFLMYQNFTCRRDSSHLSTFSVLNE